MGMQVMADNLSLIHMDGKEIRLSEFLWYFHRAGENDVDEYFTRFLEYQLKVADAKRMQIDTLPDFRRQVEFIQAKILKKHFINEQLTDSYCQRLAEELSHYRTMKDWVRIDVFTYRLSQHASDKEENNAIRVMNEWEQYLSKVGKPTDEELVLAAKKNVVKEKDASTWTSVNCLLQELSKQLESLEIGNWSKPFKSPLGIHVIRVEERKNKLDGEWRIQIEQYLDKLGTSSPAFNRSSYEKWKEGVYKLPDDVHYELTQAYEGLLALYWNRYQQQTDENQTEVNAQQLEEFFQKHKKKYCWEFPHFKGAVIHCLNKKAASKIKKKLKKLPMELWNEAFDQFQRENLEYRGELECGLFQIGKNTYIDRLAFKCGTFEPKEQFPYTFLIGKKLKKGPECYTDVLSKVTTDYLRQRENDRFSRLFARFNVEINEGVLKTVNSCGNK